MNLVKFWYFRPPGKVVKGGIDLLFACLAFNIAKLIFSGKNNRIMQEENSKERLLPAMKGREHVLTHRL